MYPKNFSRDISSESVTKCDRLKLLSTDGKSYLTDVADVEILLRLIQSVPSKKAEPIKKIKEDNGFQLSTICL